VTYLQFHLVFTLPPLLLLVFLTLRAFRLGRVPRLALGALLVHVLLALVYTTPWDNYLVARGVWGYGENRVLFTLGWVPFEEYLFFVIQTLLTGFWVLLLRRRLSGVENDVEQTAARPSPRLRVVGALVWLGLAAAGVLALGTAKGTYFGLIAAWAAPVLALQWGFGGDLLVRRWRVLLPGFAVPTLYLWLADRSALGAGIWWISPELSSGLHVFGLPLEEALFFLLTNLLVVFGMILALESRAVARLQEVRRISWWRAVLALWALSMVPTPLFPQRFAVFAYLSTSLLALGVLGYAYSRYGRRAWGLLAVAFGFGLLVEWLGHTTGVPFGSYDYTAPGPRLLGVPLLVPLGWFAFSLIALSLAPLGSKRWLAPLALVAWDVGLDPLMVSQGFWAFEQGAYYGVPLSNFLGWGVAGAVLVALLLWLEPRLTHDTSAEMRAVFWAQAFLMGVGLLVFGLPWAALCAFLAMSLVGTLAERVPGFKRQLG
jgi:lycopene beta-cyclase